MNLQSQINKLIKEKGRIKQWHRLVTVLACIVVFWTTYVMIMPAITMERETYCGYAGHIHSEACDEQNCSLEEHTHILACYSNPYADVEEASDWEASMEDVDLSDDLRSNVAAVAESQIGYKESSDNYEVMADGESVKGYTRYGAWYGSPYDDWDGMFVAFCLHYAGVSDDDMPMAYNCVEWTNVLADHDLYVSPEGYDVQAGDLVFIDDDPDDDYDGPDRVALVTEVKYNKEDLPVSIKTAEGDPSQDMVVRGAYEVDDDRLFAYGILNVESNDEAETETESESAADVIGTLNAVGEDYEVRVAYTAEAGFPEDVELCVDEVTAENDLDAYIEQSENLLDVDLSEKQNEARFFDISFKDGSGEEIRPEAGVKVSINVTPAQDPAAISDVQVVHFGDEAETVDCTTENSDALNVEFEADHFSVYGVVYSVDFEYEVDGRVYQFSIPGGETIALSDLAEALGMIGDADSDGEAAFESADQFLKEVDNVEFSDESLVKVVRTEDDWALESLQAFDTEERLTITMKNRDVVTVKVTDAQISTHYISDQGDLYEVTVTYGEDAGIPEGSRLRVTEFAEGSEEYEYARKAVLADKKSRDESVDLGAFGFAALDISIIDPEGNEIEPEAEVRVDMQIKSLPGVEELGEISDTLAVQHHVEVEDGVVVETVFDGSAEASFKLETNDKVTAEGNVVDPDTVDINDFDSEDSSHNSVDVSFGIEKFSTFTVTWRPWGAWSDRNSTVHYGYMNGNTFVEFENQPSPVDITTNYRAYLIYDFEGYQYSGYTYYRNAASSTPAAGGTRIQALLRYNSGWQYRRYSTNTNGYWYDVADNSHIYVVYEPAASIPQGGTPVPKKTDDSQYPAEPDISKKSSDNNDGTRTLSLSVTGHTEELEVEKLADVIVVFDTSGSMKEDMAGEDTYYDSRRRLTIAKNAVNTMARTLLSKTNSSGGKLIRMSLISFNDYATVDQGFTDDYSTFSRAVNNLSAQNGTNWEHALKLANQMAVESDRATFVIFVSDGNPTSRVSRMNATDKELDIYDKGTDPDYLSIYHIFGTGSTDPYGFNYDTALSEATSIVNHNKNFYTIAISNDVSNMERLTTEAGGNGNYTATTSTELENAFNDIVASITALMGHSDVQITDGITDLTQTVQKSTLVNYAEDDFTYYKGKVVVATQADVNAGRAAKVGDPIPATQADVDAGLAERVGGTKVESWQAWDPASEGCAEAVYNTTTKAVEWNMGEGFMLEDGYTYQVRFKVWPSQKAYDLLADLNNGVKNYTDLSDAEKAQISEPATAGGMYTLKTNSETSYTYREATKSGDTVTPTGEPSTPGSFPDVDPLKLTTKPLKVKKQWHKNYTASREPVSSITMQLYGVSADGSWSHDFKTITLTKDGNWQADDNYISYGLVTYNEDTDSNEKIYETGHDFTLREIDDEAHYYELTAGVFRPMFINNTPTILEQTDTTPAGMGESVFHYYDGSHHFYRLDGKIYQDTQSDTLLIATNSRRSYMDLSKVVVDESGATVLDDTEFEYNITFTVPSGIANYDSMEKYIWFSVYDSVAKRMLTPDEYTYTNAQKPAEVDSAYSGPEYDNYLFATSGNTLTIKIKQGWNVRFLNLPIGTRYSFEETNLSSGYDFVKAEVSGTRWIANIVNGTDQGSAQTMSSLPSNTSADNSKTGISGTIDFANARYSTTYTNKTLTQQVNILKTGQDGTTPLPGAVFSLYTKSGYEAEPKEAAKTGLTSGPDGRIDLGKLACGKYYLAETSAPAGYVLLSAPVEITVAADGVTYIQSDSSLSMSSSGVRFDEATKTYILTVTNNGGVELPSTGGPGTYPFIGLGSILLLGAGMLLWRRRRLI